MKQLVIKQEYFKFSYDYRILRDINTDISKNDKYILKKIANECVLDYKGLNKKQLVEMIENSGCLVLGD